MKTKVALVTGVTGQDGSYLAELLLNKGYEFVDHRLLIHRESITSTKIPMKKTRNSSCITET